MSCACLFPLLWQYAVDLEPFFSFWSIDFYLPDGQVLDKYCFSYLGSFMLSLPVYCKLPVLHHILWCHAASFTLNCISKWPFQFLCSAILLSSSWFTVLIHWSHYIRKYFKTMKMFCYVFNWGLCTETVDWIFLSWPQPRLSFSVSSDVFSRQILRVLSQYRADCKVTMVGLRALALLLRSGTRLHRNMLHHTGARVRLRAVTH